MQCKGAIGELKYVHFYPHNGSSFCWHESVNDSRYSQATLLAAAAAVAVACALHYSSLAPRAITCV